MERWPWDAAGCSYCIYYAGPLVRCADLVAETSRCAVPAMHGSAPCRGMGECLYPWNTAGLPPAEHLQRAWGLEACRPSSWLLLTAGLAAPADEIDAIAPKRETAQREMERRIVAQMLTCLDDLSGSFMAAQGEELPADAGQQGGGSGEEGRQAREEARRLLEGKHVVVIGRWMPTCCWQDGHCAPEK